MNDSKQLFILGAPRSGTTFLASLLALSRFGTPVESHFITKYAKRLDQYEPLDQEDNFCRLINDILQERAVMQWKLEISPSQLFNSFTGPIAYADIVDCLFSLRSEAQPSGHWGDKTPHYLGDFEVIRSHFPNATYLYLTRDGRDVALSLLQKSWGPSNLYTSAQYWHRLNTLSPTMKEWLETGRIFSLRYEDLLESPEQWVSQLFDFIDEPISQLQAATLSASTRADNCYKWKSQFNQTEREMFQAVAGESLDRMGYESGGQPVPPSAIRKMRYLAAEKAARVKFLFVANVVDGFRIRFLGAEPFNK